MVALIMYLNTLVKVSRFVRYVYLATLGLQT